MNTKEIGDFGESAAAEYLEKEGCEILKRNFRLRFGEVDIIARSGDCVVFVEVKTRKNNRFGEPSEYVDIRKQKRIKMAATAYADAENSEMRFDVVEVFYSETGGKLSVTKINHIDNAF